jgi:hypothetical protein
LELTDNVLELSQLVVADNELALSPLADNELAPSPLVDNELEPVPLDTAQELTLHAIPLYTWVESHSFVGC